MMNPNNESNTAKDVAAFLVELLKKESYLLQVVAVDEIQRKFGKEFTYDNKSGNLAIDRRVLAEFAKLTGDSVVWERGARLWRKRERGDDPNRKQN